MLFFHPVFILKKKKKKKKTELSLMLKYSSDYLKQHGIISLDLLSINFRTQLSFSSYNIVRCTEQKVNDSKASKAKALVL